MVKKNKSKGISNRLLYTLITIGILAIIGVGVYAYGTSNPSNFGHSAGELNLSGGVNGNATFNGNVGIGTNSTTSRLSVNGFIQTNGLISTGSGGNNGSVTLSGNLYVQGTNPSSAAWIEAPLVIGNAAFDRGYIYFPRVDAQIIPYTGNKTLRIEDNNGTVELFANKFVVNAGLVLDQRFITKPTCDNAHRGMIWFTNGGGSGEDEIQVCRRHAICAGNQQVVLGWVGLSYSCSIP